MRRQLLAVVTLTALLGSSGLAAAKSTKQLPYPLKAVWSTAVRFIRVDKNLKVTDKDRDNGYILFVFPGRGSIKECPGSLELVTVKNELGNPQIQLQLGIAHQPSWVEQQFLDHLERKLRKEQGPPPPPKRDKPAPPPKKPADRDKDNKA